MVELIGAALGGGAVVKIVDYFTKRGEWTQTDKERLWTALGEAEGHRAQLQQRLDQTEEQLHQHRLRLALAEKESESLRQGYERLKEENVHLREQVATLEAELASMRVENAALREELKQYEEAHNGES